MTTQVTTATRTPSAENAAFPIPLRIAQALMAVVGIVGIVGVTYFTMLEPEDGMTAADGAVAALLFIGSLGYIAAGRKLGSNDPEIWMTALGFAAMRVAFSVVKVFGYDEGEAVSFLVLDILIVALLMTGQPSTSPRHTPQATE
jgi:hypothetical protein